MGLKNEILSSLGLRPQLSEDANRNQMRKSYAQKGAETAYNNATQQTQPHGLVPPNGDHGAKSDERSSNRKLRPLRRPGKLKANGLPESFPRDSSNGSFTRHEPLASGSRSAGVQRANDSRDERGPNVSDPPVMRKSSMGDMDLPRAADRSEISRTGPSNDLQEIQSNESGEYISVPIALIRNTYRDLRQLKVEFPSEHLREDMPYSSRPEDLEKAVHNLIQAYKSVYQSCLDCTGQAKEFEDKISALTKEKDREINTVAKTIRDDHAHWEQRHEERLKKLQEDHQSALDGHMVKIHKLEGDMKLLKSRHESKISELTKQQQERIAISEKSSKEEKTKIQKKLDNSIESHKKQIQEILSRHAEDIQRIKIDFLREKTELSSNLNSQKDIHETQLKILRKQNADHEQLMEAELQRRSVEYERELSAIAAERDNIEHHYRTELSVAQFNYDKEIERLMEEHEREKLSIKESNEADMAQKHKGLKDVIESLKTELVTRSHFKAMSDQDLAKHFQRLVNEIDDFSRVDWESEREPTWPFPKKLILRSVNDRRTEKEVIQNTIWVILYERIFCTPFRVLGDGGKRLELEWLKIYGQDRKSPGSLALCPRASKDSEKWRYDKMKECLEANNHSLKSWEPYFDVKQGFETCLRETTEEIVQELARVAAVSIRDRQRVNDLVRAVTTLWLEVGQQRCRIFLIMSRSGKEPSRSGLAALGKDGTQELVLVPELRRIGNAQGERLDRDELVSDCKGSFSIFHG